MLIALAAAKGGAGKTTLAVALADLLSARGLKVLLVDMDHQASATEALGVRPPKEALRWVEQLVRPLVVREGLHLYPSGKDLEYHLSRVALGMLPMPRLPKAHYDAVIVDTARGSIHHERSLLAEADRVLIPALMEPAAAVGVRRLAAELPSALIVPNRYDRRARYARSLLEALRRAYGAWPEGRVLPPVRFSLALQQLYGTGFLLHRMETESARKAIEDLETIIRCLL